MSQWYIYRNNERYGPYTIDAVRDMNKNKNLFDDDLIWGPGFTDWKKVSHSKEIIGIKTVPSKTVQQAPIAQKPDDKMPKSAKKPKKKVVVYIITAAIIALIIIAGFLLGGFALAMRLVNYIFTALFILVAVNMAMSFNKFKVLNAKSLIISALISPVVMLFYLLTNTFYASWVLVVIFLAGAVLGIIWGLITKVKQNNGYAYGMATLAGFLFWSFTFAVMKVVNFFIGSYEGLFLMLLMLQSGIIMLYNLTLALKVKKAKA